MKSGEQEFWERLTVNDAVLLFPRTLTVFRKHGIDSCCGGGLTISTVAERHGISLEALQQELLLAMARAGAA